MTTGRRIADDFGEIRKRLEELSREIAEIKADMPRAGCPKNPDGKGLHSEAWMNCGICEWCGEQGCRA